MLVLFSARTIGICWTCTVGTFAIRTFAIRTFAIRTFAIRTFAIRTFTVRTLVEVPVSPFSGQPKIFEVLVLVERKLFSSDDKSKERAPR